MKKNQENTVGEPGQFKTTPVVGFTPTDRTPTPPPFRDRERTIEETKTDTPEKKQLKRVLRHRRKGVK